MRYKHTIVVLLIALVGTTTLSMTGQEEPLPAIKAKGSVEPLTPSIVLAIEPNSAYTPPTLGEAARANNYFAFDAMYRDSVRRGESVAAFAALHELWTYGITDPIGAFYGIETYERFARMYPAYATYIDRYRIVDSNGNVFYPTSETRAFLLDRALEGRAPRVQVAESTPPSEQSRSVASGTPASSPAGPVASRRRALAKRERVIATPTRAAARDAAVPAGGDARVPLTTGTVGEKPTAVVAEKPSVVETPIVETPIVAEPAITEAPVVVRAEPQAVEPVPQPIAVKNDFGGRGIFLLLIGILGLGILAMMLRAPRELPPSIMTPQTPPTIVPSPSADKISAPVEPIRRPSAAPPPPPPGKNRAGGSHG